VTRALILVSPPTSCFCLWEIRLKIRWKMGLFTLLITLVVEPKSTGHGEIVNFSPVIVAEKHGAFRLPGRFRSTPGKNPFPMGKIPFNRSGQLTLSHDRVWLRGVRSLGFFCHGSCIHRTVPQNRGRDPLGPSRSRGT
jgi:hypothetical protein